MNSILKPPKFPDEGLTQTARALHIVLWTLMGAALLLLLMPFLLPGSVLRWAATAAFCETLCLILLVLNQKGQTQRATGILIVGFWLLLTILVLTGGGMRAPAVTGYLPLIFIAGLLRGGKAGILTALLCVLTTGGVVLLDITGSLPASSVYHTAVSVWISFILYVSIIVSFQYLASLTISDALKQTRAELKQRTFVEDALRESESRYRALVDNSPDGIVVIRDEKLVYVNPTAARMMQIEQQTDIIGRPFDELVADDDRTRMKDRRIHMLATRTVEPPVVWHLRRRDGAYIDVLGVTVPITFEGGPAILCSFRDVSGWREVQSAIRESEARLRQVMDLVPHFIFAKNRKGQFILVNKAVADAYGTTVDNLLGKTDADFNPDPAEVQHFLEDDNEVMDSGALKDIAEEKITDTRGKVRYLHTIKIPYKITATNIDAVLGVSTDITERKFAEEKLRQTAEQLRSLSNRLQAIREEEGARIAREIHDELGQTLTVLKMDLASLEEMNATNREETSREVSGKIASMSNQVDSVIRTVRRISSELRPDVLDSLGLVAAIEWQAEEFRKRTGMRCSCRIPAEEWEIDQERSTAIFRILQESLTNIARHSGASEVQISFRRNRNNLVLQVDDNGKGIAKTDRAKTGSFGLLGMQERASVFGGTVTISSGPEKGTSIIVSIPMGGPAQGRNG